MRFVLAKAQSQYGSLRLHIDQLALALRALGQTVEVVDIVGDGAVHRLVQACLAPTDCLFGFSGIGSEIAVPGRVFGDPTFVYASLYVDHPAHCVERLSRPIPRQAVFFLDHSHVRFAQLWAQPGAFAHIGFLPPGANTLDAAVDTSDAAFAARDIPILFTGTYRGAPSPAWADWPDNPSKALVEAAARLMEADGRLAVADALDQVLAAHGRALTPDLLRAAAPLASVVQFHAEAVHRHRILSALGEAGAPLTVYGAGWEPMIQASPSFTWGGLGSFEETLGLLRRARLVLNINNGFLAGGHERVFTALCAGAAVFSDTSAYYDAAFAPGEMATYDINRPAEAAQGLTALAGDVPAQAAIARAGHARGMAEHQWTSRAAQLIRVVAALR
jgi:hypothetical protein